MLETIPVYVISGLLESGKTTFIKDTIASDDFFTKGKTLILSGEEGEIEYEEEFLKKYNSEIIYFDSQDEFTVLNIQDIVNKSRPNRIVIELNGMWDISKIEFPINFKVYQFINFINYQTFPIYFNNMRQLFLDYVKQSDVVVFINVEDKEQLENYSSIFKITNSSAQFMVMDEKGLLSDAFKITLPYDIEADIIKINADDYGVFYIDLFENKEKYINKTIDVDLMVFMSKTLPKNTFVAGRMVMNCCSDDIQLFGHLCVNSKKVKLKDRSFINLVAQIKFEWSEQYQEEECVLYPISIKEIAPFENPVLDLTK